MCHLRNILVRSVISVTIILTIISFSIFSLGQTAQASTNEVAQNLSLEIAQNWNPFREFWHRLKLRTNPPRGAEATGRSRPGGGRGPKCALAQEDVKSGKENKFASSVVALAPVRTLNENGDLNDDLIDSQDEDLVSPDTGIVGGFTVKAQPTFWFYIPYVLIPKTSSKRIAQFVLLDEDNHPVLKELVSFELSEKPQLLEYQSPYNLKTDKLYKWYFSVVCDADKRSRNPAAQGWVQRIEPTSKLEAELMMASPVTWYEIYAENGLWFETVSSLINNRRNFSGANRQEWNELLTYFKIAEENSNQFNLLLPTEPVEREVVIIEK